MKHIIYKTDRILCEIDFHGYSSIEVLVQKTKSAKDTNIFGIISYISINLIHNHSVVMHFLHFHIFPP